MLFTRAIVRVPCKEIVNGLTTSNLGKPDYKKALEQHTKYIELLKQCGLAVTILQPDSNYPDSVFVEDTAVITPHCAIITNPGAHSRRGEIVEIKEVLKKFFTNIEHIQSPGTLDGGDIIMVGDHCYIGLSKRTNLAGAQQIIKILNKYGITSSIVHLKKVLHLKSGVTYLENNNLVAAGEFIKKQDFQKFNIIEIDEDENYAANCVWINGVVLVPKDFPKAKKAIESAGYNTVEVDVSEFRKIDGGLSCLSLRF